VGGLVPRDHEVVQLGTMAQSALTSSRSLALDHAVVVGCSAGVTTSWPVAVAGRHAR
jgi:hypothetical protein